MSEQDRSEPSLDELFALERAAPGMPESSASSLDARLAPLLGVPSASLPNARTSTVGHVTSLASTTGKWLAAAAVFGTGTVLGATLQRELGEPRVVEVVADRSVDRPETFTSDASPEPLEEVPPLVSASSDEPPAVSLYARRQAPSANAHGERVLDDEAKEDDASFEQGLIARARAALARRDAEAALSALEIHRSEYPEGTLAEERAVLEITSLSVLGRGDLARSKIAAFTRDYPRSMFRDTVEHARAALDGAPEDR